MTKVRLTLAQGRYLARGGDQAGGKLPLFDESGQRIAASTIQACIRHGWAEPWFTNPIKPDWLVCRLTARGREAVETHQLPPERRPPTALRLVANL